MKLVSKTATLKWLPFAIGLCLSIVLSACGGGGPGGDPGIAKTVYLNERVQLVFPESTGAASLSLNNKPVSSAAFTSSSVYFDVTLATLGGTYVADTDAVVSVGGKEVLRQPLKIVESALVAGNELAVYTQGYSEAELKAALDKLNSDKGLSDGFKIKGGTFKVNSATSGTAVVTFGQQATGEANKLLNSLQEASGKALSSSPNLLYGISGKKGVYWSSPRCDVLDALDEYVAEGDWKLLKKDELFALLGIQAAQAGGFTGDNTITPIVDTGNGDFDKFDCDDAKQIKEGHGKYIYNIVSSTATGVTFDAETVCDSKGFCSTEQIINYFREIESNLLSSKNQRVIVNLSISGSKGLNDTIDQAIYDRLKYYQEKYPKNFLAVAAAGNYGISADSTIAGSPAYPASFSDAVDTKTGLGNIISVGAVGRTNANTWKVSETNPKNVAVDILAPGIKLCIETTPGKCAPYGDDVGITGSSFSTAIVTGVAAMMWSACPDLTAKEIKTLMQEQGTAVDGTSYKLINADPGFRSKCNGNPNPPTGKDPFGDSKELKLGDVGRGQILTNTDRDHYKVTTTETGILELNLSSIPAGIYLYMSVYDENKVLQTSVNSISSGEAGQLFILSAAKPFFIEIGRWAGNPSTEFYELRATLDTTDKNELNNTFDTATTINLNSLTKGTMYGSDDVDYHKITTTETGVLELDLSAIPTGSYLNFTLYNSERVQIGQEVGINTGEAGQFRLLTAPGTFYMLVSLYTGARNTQLYELRASLDTTDTNELNNTFDTATILPIGVTEQGTLYGTGDVDYYRIDVPTAQSLEVVLSSIPTGSYFNRYIYNDQKVSIDQDVAVSSGTSSSFILTSNGATTYYVLINFYTGDRTKDLYNLSVQSVPTP
jgi:Subtilase family